MIIQINYMLEIEEVIIKDYSFSSEVYYILHYSQSLIHKHNIDITLSSNYWLNGREEERDSIYNNEINVDIMSGDDDNCIIINNEDVSVICNEG